MMFYVGIGSLIFAGMASAQTAATQASDAIQTPQQVWAGFDPHKEPLDIKKIKEWSEDGADYQEFYFTSETYEGAPVRVYAIYAAPKGGKNLPALLHIHGGGQTASPNWLKFWTARGYAAMTFDFCGKWADREKYTDYGKLETSAMGGHQGWLETTEPSVRASKWYHWALMARRSLTVLEGMPEVDPKRLGIFGISVGGSLVWYVAGVDERVKATCAIYGCGWNTHPKSIYAPDPKKDDPATILWRKTMEPEAYAPLITQPLLLLDASNDHHGKMDWAYQTLASVKAPWHVAFTPYYRHHIEEEQGVDLPLFMDACLRNGPAWPKTPDLKITLDQAGVPQATFRPDTTQTIKKVEIYYAVHNEDPINRYWRPAASNHVDQTWTAALPISNTHDRLFAFANVVYDSGLCLTSNFQVVVPADLGSAQATDQPSLLIGDFSHGFDGFTTSSPGTDPAKFTTVMETKTGADGITALHMLGRVTLWTTKLNDPKWKAPDKAKLSFLVQVSDKIDFDVVLIENDNSLDSVEYSHRVQLEKKAGWQEVVLSPEDFKSEKGHGVKAGTVLSSWKPFDTFQFGSKRGDRIEGVALANIRWVVPTAP